MRSARAYWCGFRAARRSVRLTRGTITNNNWSGFRPQYTTKMEITSTISYHWEAVSGIPTPEKHEEALMAEAKQRIFEMLKEGYSSGELCATVRLGQDVVPEEDTEEGIEYTGWWSLREN